jgi:hypothetical protein
MINIKYRNGESGFLLTTERPGTAYCTLTMKKETGCIIHHDAEGNYLGYTEDKPLDIIWEKSDEQN